MDDFNDHSEIDHQRVDYLENIGATPNSAETFSATTSRLELLSGSSAESTSTPGEFHNLKELAYGIEEKPKSISGKELPYGWPKIENAGYVDDVYRKTI